MDESQKPREALSINHVRLLGAKYAFDQEVTGGRGIGHKSDG